MNNKEVYVEIERIINEAFKSFYKKLLDTTNIFAAEAIEEFSEKRNSVIENSSFLPEIAFYTNLPNEDSLNDDMAEGQAHKLFLDWRDVQDDLDERNFLVSSSDFESISNFDIFDNEEVKERRLSMQVHPELEIFQPAAQIIGFSLVKNSLLAKGQPLPQNSTWKDYKEKTLLAIDALKGLAKIPFTNDNSSFLSLMLEEKNPCIQAFRDAINYVCESIGLGSPCLKSTTQEYKKALSGITSSLLKENIDKPEEKNDDADDTVKKSM
ncbi:MAG: hypothetical protein H0U73_12440 [Tatlockia sp.]|nr:hypothetical protein [Tatlockia sp.]